MGWGQLCSGCFYQISPFIFNTYILNNCHHISHSIILLSFGHLSIFVWRAVGSLWFYWVVASKFYAGIFHTPRLSYRGQIWKAPHWSAPGRRGGGEGAPVMKRRLPCLSASSSSHHIWLLNTGLAWGVVMCRGSVMQRTQGFSEMHCHFCKGGGSLNNMIICNFYYCLLVCSSIWVIFLCAVILSAPYFEYSQESVQPAQRAQCCFVGGGGGARLQTFQRARHKAANTMSSLLSPVSI